MADKPRGRPPLDADDIELLNGRYVACADDLRRWAAAFASYSEDPTRDHETAAALTALADQLEEKARG